MPKQTVTRRGNLKVMEVSFVRAPANPGAMIAYWKSDDAFQEYALFRREAQRAFPDAPSPEQAVAAYLRTAEGQAGRAKLVKTAPRQHDRQKAAEARAELQARAEALRKQQPQFTIEQARVEIMKLDPALRARLSG